MKSTTPLTFDSVGVGWKLLALKWLALIVVVVVGMVKDQLTSVDHNKHRHYVAGKSIDRRTMMLGKVMIEK